MTAHDAVALQQNLPFSFQTSKELEAYHSRGQAQNSGSNHGSDIVERCVHLCKAKSMRSVANLHARGCRFDLLIAKSLSQRTNRQRFRTICRCSLCLVFSMMTEPFRREHGFCFVYAPARLKRFRASVCIILPKFLSSFARLQAVDTSHLVHCSWS